MELLFWGQLAARRVPSPSLEQGLSVSKGLLGCSRRNRSSEKSEVVEWGNPSRAVGMDYKLQAARDRGVPAVLLPDCNSAQLT